MEKNSKGLRKGAWTKEEDRLLIECVNNYGQGKWHLIPIRAGLNRCRKSCRLRWMNYLRPNIIRSCFKKDEVDLMIRMHKLLGNKWTLIAGRLPGRTANDVKNFWNTHIQKKLAATNHRGRELAHKTITRNNIMRPRPRTFAKPVQIQWPRENVTKTNDLPDTFTTEQDKPDYRQPNTFEDQAAFCASISKDEEDQCFQWWRNLLEKIENGDEGHDYVPNNDVDAWGFNLSFDHEEADMMFENLV